MPSSSFLPTIARWTESTAPTIARTGYHAELRVRGGRVAVVTDVRSVRFTIPADPWTGCDSHRR